MGAENAFEHVRPFGNTGLLDHTRRALERVRQSQQAHHTLGRKVAFLQLQYSLCQAIKKLPRLDSEILVRVLSHGARCWLAAESRASARARAW